MGESISLVPVMEPETVETADELAGRPNEAVSAATTGVAKTITTTAPRNGNRKAA